MKAKWIGLLLLIVVALGAVGYVWFSQTTQVTEITGYVGGEKIGLLEDEQVRKILKDKYRLSLDYNRAGSIEMVTTLDRAGQDFLFPSNQTALELFEGEGGAPEKSQIVFNTPIVLYTHAAVAEALGLHRNTVINRIRKAEELLGLDLSDSGLGSALLTGIDMRSHAFAARGEGANG